ncbi:anti-sigma factor [Nonomuraea harbinensis]|uniref:Anti-sigma factor domain-containing protein n=2 Tax=Nonomuraea TaxID=83681 RepID=A0ABW1BWM1_9ACTN|nr:anti-sigma factor [Nonomuraea harbinensis]
MDDELHALSGAYAAHALPPADVASFEEHLSSCRTCPSEVSRLRETAARLALAVATPPPASLRPRVLTAAHRRHDTVHPAADRTPRADVLPPRRGWRAKAVAGLAAVSAAAAVALGVVAFDARRDLGDLRAGHGALVTEVAAVLAAPDARTVRHRIASGGTGVAVVSRERGRILFTSSGMPELPPSKVYALWLMNPDGVRPAGLLDRGEDGLTAPVVADLRDDVRLGLTVEPAGGSDRPTTRPILFAELPAA